MQTEITFGEFIKSYNFIIPDYQRAYSWGEKQLIPFINDILEHCDDNDNAADDTKYYLGHYILEKPNESAAFEIVDGQQRISTVYLFLMVCSAEIGRSFTRNINFSPVSYDIPGLEKIKAILNGVEDVELQLELLLKEEITSSLKRMIEAVLLFKRSFKGSEKLKVAQILCFDEIDKYVNVINNAYCSVAIFKDKSVASQIFELHNTRGVKLTETEKVKALLMKNIYISSATRSEADRNIKEIQRDFAKVFELEEKANKEWLRGEMCLDTILMYHLRAVEDGYKKADFNLPQSAEENRGPFDFVKERLSCMTDEEIVIYSKNIANEFAYSMKILTVDIPLAEEQDENHLIGDVLLLDRNRSMIFLLRAFRIGNPIENQLVQRWENFLLCYFIIYWNGFYYNAKAYREDFDSIYKSIKGTDLGDCNKLLVQYYTMEKEFSYHWQHLGKNAYRLFTAERKKWLTNAYFWDRTAYFLYKYELSKGADHKTIKKAIFKKDNVSKDHIVARGLSWESLGFEGYERLHQEDETKINADKLWNEILSVINGIGNLALSTTSYNASDSNGLPNEHISTYQKCGLHATAADVKKWVNPNQFAERIRHRSEDICNFISESIINRNDIWGSIEID